MCLHISGTLLWQPTIKNSGIFENQVFLRVKKAEIVNFEHPPWIFLVCNVSICPIYMLTIYIWPTQKCILRQSMCTHVAHTLHFSNKNCFVKKNSVVGTMCAVWVHILCLIIHFLAVQIWFFIFVKYQFSVT